MRRRLIIVFLVPVIAILIGLGAAYAWSVARSVQQSATTETLGDVSYFLTGARQALGTGNMDLLKSEMDRYNDLTGNGIAVYDRSNQLQASSGIDAGTLSDDDMAKVSLALAGGRSELSKPSLPWEFGELTLVEPVFDTGNAIGAVVISADTDAHRGEICRQWLLLVAVVGVITVLLIIAVNHLANWVLRPMHRVDRAIAAIERGDMDARIEGDTGPPEMRQMIHLFNGMAEELERVMTRQREFAMNASHELRNPLGALLMRVDSLATGLDESWDDEVEKTREEGARMRRILDTLLDLARAGHEDSMFAPVDLSALARSRVDAWRPVAQGEEIRFALTAAPQLWAVTDRTALESAFDAVIDNAVKIAPPGSVIDVEARRREADLVLSVRDRGPGLSEEELAHVTDRFWRSARDQNLPGSGLGLAIATDLLASLGGSIEVSSPDGPGLLVRLILPERSEVA